MELTPHGYSIRGPGLPAVIGAGELLYKKCLSADLLLLDCAGRRVEAVR